MGASLSCCSQQELPGGLAEDIISSKQAELPISSGGKDTPSPACIEPQTEAAAPCPRGPEGAPPRLAAEVSAEAADGKAEEGEAGRATEQQHEPAEVVEKAKQKPDLSGGWLMASYEGDFNAFMTEVGAPWIARKAAGAMNYGVGKSVVTMQMNGDNFVMTRSTPMGTFETRHTINGCEQDEVDPMSKKAMKVTPYWEELEDGKIVFTTEGYSVADKTKAPTVRRWLESGSLMQEMTTPKGLVIKTTFSKMPDAA